MNREQEYIDTLVRRIEWKYVCFERNIQYKKGNLVVGELDLIAYYEFLDGACDVYEVKSNSKPKLLSTAQKQLERALNIAPYDIQHVYIYIGKKEIITYPNGELCEEL